MTKRLASLRGWRPALLALAVLGAAFVSAASARAETSVITQFSQSSEKGAYTASFTVSGDPKTHLIRLANPERFAVDFDDTLPGVAIGPGPDEKSAEGFPDKGLVDGIRQGLVSKDRYRVIFRIADTATVAAKLTSEAAGVGRIVRIAITPRTASGAERPDAAPPAPEVAAEPQAQAASATKPPNATRPLTIVLDPGHGGVDDGAISPKGTLEKNVNLAMGKALRDALLSWPCIKVVMTRDDDTFVPLAKRSRIGREAHADLFISLHADSIRHAGNLRGATVYTLSDKASDALSRQIAQSENAADRFADDSWSDDTPGVFDILVDLTRRETVSFSEHFAGSLVKDLEQHDINLINRPKRSAAFIVLKAPDVPSVLIELGFLSNAEDEKLLLDPAWRKKTAEAIAGAVVRFFRGGAAQTQAAGR